MRSRVLATVQTAELQDLDELFARSWCAKNDKQQSQSRAPRVGAERISVEREINPGSVVIAYSFGDSLSLSVCTTREFRRHPVFRSISDVQFQLRIQCTRRIRLINETMICKIGARLRARRDIAHR